MTFFLNFFAHFIAHLGQLSHCVALIASTLLRLLLERHKCIRLFAFFAGLFGSLGLLFAAFATELHQFLLSFVLLHSLCAETLRCSCDQLNSQYFKRRLILVVGVQHTVSGLALVLMAHLIYQTFRYMIFLGKRQT